MIRFMVLTGRSLLYYLQIMTYEHGNDWTRRFPCRILVANLTYDVVVMDLGYDREQQRFGECVNNDQIIRLSSQMKEQKARETLLHELMHAFVWCGGLLDPRDDDTWEERISTMLPKALICFARDNPGLWEWLFALTPELTITSATWSASENGNAQETQGVR